jgi:hypothetical protein
MNSKCKIFLLCFFCFTTILAQKNQSNVLSYYAVGNSLDGQLMSDMENVLRFFPVYAMQQQIDSVRVTVYYGGKIFTRYANRAISGSYWEALLPQFRLGEAIQRLEILIRFKLDEYYSERYSSLTESRNAATENIKEIESEGREIKRKLQSITDTLEKNGVSYLQLRSLRQIRQKRAEVYSIERNKILSSENLSDSTNIDSLIKQYITTGTDYLTFSRKNRPILKEIYLNQDYINSQIDSMKRSLAKEIEVDLLDTLYSGTSMRRSDLTIDSDFEYAHLLYRNYKPSLRYMPALDPAERMGIFRIRYVPFPIVGTPDKPRPMLLKPMNTNSPTVFEVGLAFGDAIVPGDDFVPPEFSWKRLGIAFAITEQLFSDSAQVLGLALTYDFNSYGSIGIGGNFAGKTAHGYASLGINKKAFEAVIKGLTGLFK